MNVSEWSRGRLTLCLVVPLFNEQDRIVESFDHLADFMARWPPGSRLVFVDDGSTDDTVDVVTDAIGRWPAGDVTLIRRPHAGKGAAVRCGLRTAETDLAAFCDVDLATPLDELDRLIRAAAEANGLIIGSRAAPDAAIERREPRSREMAGRAFNLVVRASLCPGIVDTQCGAKAAPTPVWRELLEYSTEDGFSWDVEIVALALRFGLPVAELGVKWVHDGRTRVRVWRDGATMVVALVRVARSVRRAPMRSEAAVAGAYPAAAR